MNATPSRDLGGHSGQLVCAFTGHGGEIGLSSERILQVPDIQTFSNGALYSSPSPASSVDSTIRKGFCRRIWTAQSMEALLLCIPLSGWCMLVSKPSTSPRHLRHFVHPCGRQAHHPGRCDGQMKNSNGSSDKLKFSLFGDPALSFPFLN